MTVEMDENRAAVKRPWWVRFTLWGLPNRASAMAFVWLTLAAAAAAAICGFWDWRYRFGALLVLAALGYLLAVRWVDTHGGWS
jgi:membrane protein implicated in regulation of membrane protease activity